MTQMWVRFTHGASYACVCVLSGCCCCVGVEGVEKGVGRRLQPDTQGRTGSSVEALLAQSVAGQISWRAVCRGCGTLQQRAWGGQATARLLSTPQFESIYVFLPPHLSLSLLSLTLSIAETKRGATFLPNQTDRNMERKIAPPMSRNVTAHQLFLSLRTVAHVCVHTPVGGCCIVAQVDAGEDRKSLGFFFFFFFFWCSLCLRPVQRQGGGLHGKRKAAIKLGDSGGSGTVFDPPPQKKKKKTTTTTQQKFINFRGTIQIFRFVLCSETWGSVPGVDLPSIPLHVNPDQTLHLCTNKRTSLLYSRV